MRYGIYGGAFDPVHTGHLILAECCLNQANLDRVIFVPTGVSPHHAGKSNYHASAEDRYNMLEDALIGCDEFLISRFEIDRQETSYTFDTVRYFQQTFSLTNPELRLIMGADMLNDLPNWHNAAELIAAAPPLAAERPGTALPYHAGLSNLGTQKLLDEIRTSAVSMPQVDISSTLIRRYVQEKKSIRFLVPRGVEAYIAAHGLYHET